MEVAEDKVTYYAPLLIGIGLGVAMIQVVEFCFVLLFVCDFVKCVIGI